MLEFVQGKLHDLSAHTKNQLFGYRHQVFVNQLGWDLNTSGDVETDQFDHDGSVYVMAKDTENDIVGCARLLPTTEPYLLECVFPELLNGMPPPKENTTWELSRFTSMDLKSKQSISPGQLSSPSTESLLRKSMAVARNHGAKRMISVSPIGIERLLRKMNIVAHRAGPPKIINGYPLIACWIDLNQ